jgi:hypothetical protein
MSDDIPGWKFLWGYHHWRDARVAVARPTTKPPSRWRGIVGFLVVGPSYSYLDAVLIENTAGRLPEQKESHQGRAAALWVPSEVARLRASSLGTYFFWVGRYRLGSCRRSVQGIFVGSDKQTKRSAKRQAHKSPADRLPLDPDSSATQVNITVPVDDQRRVPRVFKRAAISRLLRDRRQTTGPVTF